MAAACSFVVTQFGFMIYYQVMLFFLWTVFLFHDKRI